MCFQFSARSIERMKGVHPDLVFVFQEALKISPIDFGIPEYGGLRSKEEQARLHADIKSRCDGVRKLSLHQSGKALDFYAYLNGAASWDKIHLGIIAGVIMSAAKLHGVKVKWGGEFGSNEFHGWDYPHIELEG